MMEEDGCKVQPPVKIIKDGRKPAEVYRTDLITAMKIPDHQLVLSGSYFNLTDAWKQDWEKGVQVPVNMDSLPQPSFRLSLPSRHVSPEFKMPNKFIKNLTKEEKKLEKPVSYDLDDEDVEWLKGLNRSRRNKGLEVVDELQMEKVLTHLEDQCYTNMGETIATAKGLSIEYDEDISCDVCRMPECEDGNEIVFCDICDVAVHQACYGVQNVPVGSWVCKPCAQLLSNCPCLLCSTRGGAMKRTKSKGIQGWTHMSCALWIPEVGIGDVGKMEPITRIETITPGRWNLLCYLCKERKGACIQCSVKTCVTAFHVTCGFNNKLEMQTVLDESAPDGVRHECYCYKHGPKRPGRSPRKSSSSTPRKGPHQSTSSPSKPSSATKAKQQEEQENLRQKKLRRMEEEFYKFVDAKNLASELQISTELAKTFHRFWTLKRKARDDASLLPPTAEQQECLTGRKTKPYQRASMEIERVVRFRQDLERVRNLCYMVEKREKQKRKLIRARESVFRKELEIVEDSSGKMSCDDVRWARSCCTKNFTEYETLQRLDLHLPHKTHKRHTKKRRRRVQQNNVLSSAVEEVFSTPGEDSPCPAKEGDMEREDDSDCSEQCESASMSFTSNVEESPSGVSNGRKTSVKTSVSSSEHVSNEDRDVTEVMRETCFASSRHGSKRLEEFSSDSDFEDELRKARSVRRRRIVPFKLPRKVQQKNDIMGCNNVTSSSPGETDRLTNCVRIDRPGEGCLGLVEMNNLKTVDGIKDMVLRSPKRVISTKINMKRNRLFGEFSRDDCGSQKNEKRIMRSSRTVLDGQMVLDKFDIPLSPKRYCRRNGVVRNLNNDENADQNRSLTEPDDDPKINAEVSSRTRSRHSDSGPPPPESPTRTDGALSKGDTTDRNSRSNCKPCAVANKESLVDRCRTRRSPTQSPDAKTSSASFGNSAQCSRFFGKFRQTATTSA